MTAADENTTPVISEDRMLAIRARKEKIVSSFQMPQDLSSTAQYWQTCMEHNNRSAAKRYFPSKPYESLSNAETTELRSGANYSTDVFTRYHWEAFDKILPNQTINGFQLNHLEDAKIDQVHYKELLEQLPEKIQDDITALDCLDTVIDYCWKGIYDGVEADKRGTITPEQRRRLVLGDCEGYTNNIISALEQKSIKYNYIRMSGTPEKVLSGLAGGHTIFSIPFETTETTGGMLPGKYAIMIDPTIAQGLPGDQFNEGDEPKLYDLEITVVPAERQEDFIRLRYAVNPTYSVYINPHGRQISESKTPAKDAEARIKIKRPTS